MASTGFAGLFGPLQHFMIGQNNKEAIVIANCFSSKFRKDAGIFIRIIKRDYFSFVVITLEAPQKLTNRVIRVTEIRKDYCNPWLILHSLVDICWSSIRSVICCGKGLDMQTARVELASL